MIKEKIKGNVFDSQQTNIVFAVNTEGFNDSGFAGQVSRLYWPDLACTGKKEIGTVMSHTTDEGRIFHACVCHSLKENGWEQSPKVIKECLDSMDIPVEEDIAVVLMGAGLIGQMQGANVPAILEAMESSEKSLIVYSL